MAVSIPNNFNATVAVTVYVTNSNPSVLTINGSAAPVTTLTFAAGAASSQNLTVAGNGPGLRQIDDRLCQLAQRHRRRHGAADLRIDWPLA